MKAKGYELFANFILQSYHIHSLKTSTMSIKTFHLLYSSWIIIFGLPLARQCLGVRARWAYARAGALPLRQTPGTPPVQDQPKVSRENRRLLQEAKKLPQNGKIKSCLSYLRSDFEYRVTSLVRDFILLILIR